MISQVAEESIADPIAERNNHLFKTLNSTIKKKRKLHLAVSNARL